MKRLIYYEVSQNQDQTEGRGPMIAVSWWSSEKDAVKDSKGRGVMGVGDGEVHAVYLEDGFNDLHGTKRNLTKELVWGYRKDWAGKWGHGYADNRDAPTRDPDYQQYLKLKAKFGG